MAPPADPEGVALQPDHALGGHGWASRGRCRRWGAGFVVGSNGKRFKAQGWGAGVGSCAWRPRDGRLKALAGGRAAAQLAPHGAQVQAARPDGVEQPCRCIHLMHAGTGGRAGARLRSDSPTGEWW